MNQLKKKYAASIMGLVIGDALGVPVEFVSRDELKENPVTDMIGYGTHNQPAGTWSDDSSMAVATMEWLGEIETQQPDYKRLMDKFSNWILYGDYTPYQENFDCGISTCKAIMNYGRGTEPLLCGEKGEFNNGNGSLMRILPAALYYSAALAGDEMSGAEIIYNLSALTHAHMRSKLGCLIYSKVIADMVYGTGDKFDTVESSIHKCKQYLDSFCDENVLEEMQHYSRLWDLQKFKMLEENEIKSSGYVVDTLEAALWCFLNTTSYKECVLKAVNLGDDTDTVGAIAGGLAGLYYEMDALPKDWLAVIPKKEWIMELAEKM